MRRWPFHTHSLYFSFYSYSVLACVRSSHFIIIIALRSADLLTHTQILFIGLLKQQSRKYSVWCVLKMPTVARIRLFLSFARLNDQTIYCKPSTIIRFFIYEIINRIYIINLRSIKWVYHYANPSLVYHPYEYVTYGVRATYVRIGIHLSHSDGFDHITSTEASGNRQSDRQNSYQRRTHTHHRGEMTKGYENCTTSYIAVVHRECVRFPMKIDEK